MESSVQENSQGWSNENMKSRVLADSGQGVGSLLLWFKQSRTHTPHLRLPSVAPEAGTQGASQSTVNTKSLPKPQEEGRGDLAENELWLVLEHVVAQQVPCPRTPVYTLPHSVSLSTAFLVVHYNGFP